MRDVVRHRWLPLATCLRTDAASVVPSHRSALLLALPRTGYVPLPGQSNVWTVARDTPVASAVVGPDLSSGSWLAGPCKLPQLGERVEAEL